MKTINGDDLLWAMATLGFEYYIDPLNEYLVKYTEIEGDGKGSAKGAGGSARNNGGVNYDNSQVQVAHQGSYFQGMSYADSQPNQHTIASVQGLDSGVRDLVLAGHHLQTDIQED